jgi:hypothetical protein
MRELLGVWRDKRWVTWSVKRLSVHNFMQLMQTNVLGRNSSKRIGRKDSNCMLVHLKPIKHRDWTTAINLDISMNSLWYLLHSISFNLIQSDTWTYCHHPPHSCYLEAHKPVESRQSEYDLQIFSKFVVEPPFVSCYVFRLSCHVLITAVCLSPL